MESDRITELGPLIGEWSLEVDLPGAPPGDIGARCTFEWMEGEQFLIQRWTVPVPEAPDGTALIGYDEGRGTLLQHYFDTRGVARVYEMTFAEGLWTLTREKPDFSPLDFHQRFEAKLSDDGGRFDGRWEISHDAGDTWELDFNLTYARLS